MNKLVLIFLIIIPFSLYSKQDKIFIQADSINWNMVFYKTREIDTSIFIANKSLDTLKIIDILATCGCTRSQIDKKILPPNDTAKIHIVVQLPNKDGILNKKISLVFSDSNLNFDIQLSAEVYSILRASPLESFLFFDIKQGVEKKSSEITIANNTDEDITINEIEISKDFLKTDFKKGQIIKARGYIKTRAYCKTDIIGKFEEKIKIKTNNKKADLLLKALGKVSN